MRELLLIDLVICAAVIAVAAAVLLRRRREGGRPRTRVQEQPREQPGEQAAESMVSAVAVTDLGHDGLAAGPDEPPAAAGAANLSERIRGYYEEADQPVAGYLAARGWPEQQGAPGQVADADTAPGSPEAAARPDTARRRMAA